jgi:sulfur carrier protein
MRVLINGEHHELPDGTTVAGAVELLHGEAARRGMAVAVAGEVVPRGAWGQTALREGERVEVVTAVQGG